MKQKTLIKIGFLCSKNLPSFLYSLSFAVKSLASNDAEPKRLKLVIAVPKFTDAEKDRLFGDV